MLTPQFLLPIHNEITVDLFAGGGGASTGIEQAIGRPVDIAVNHDPQAVSLHAANHPQTEHFCSDVFEVDPVTVTAGRPVGLLWASPDCKHFSKAKGAKPVSKKIRGLAWVVIRWAKAVRPRVICLENVEEFKTWGPLGPDSLPCPARKGTTFARWVAQLRNLGYAVDWRELRGCDYGAPTIRKRFFLVARCDGQPIVWPEPTHAAPDSLAVQAKKLKLWRTAAECIDWSIPCPSIFERKKPLADATCRRIAKGLVRYVIEAKQPFIVSIANWSGESIRGVDKPLSTVTAHPKGGHHALVVPTLIQAGYGERPGQSPRVPGLDKPLGTVVAGGTKHALVTAFLAKHYTGVVGSDLSAPIGTVTSVDHHSLVAAHLVHMGHGERCSKGRPRWSDGTRDVTQPLNTVTASNSPAAVVTSHLVKMRGDNVGAPVTEPLHTVSAQGLHHAEVRAFLIKFYSEGGQHQDLSEPMHTIPTRDRMGLVTVTIAGEEYFIADVGLRMLKPHELYKAQGFPDDYHISTGADGAPLSQEAQVRMCGNSVNPQMSRALVAANYVEPQRQRAAA